MDLFIVRGLPGAGKTTIARLITETVLSADDYFVDEKGVYRFDPSLVKLAHRYCQRLCYQAMEQKIPKIAIANTFSQEWEFEPYYDLAQSFNYRVHSIIAENRHGSENIHNVPYSIIHKMRDRFKIVL